MDMGYFPFIAVISYASVNICVQVFVWTYVFIAFLFSFHFSPGVYLGVGLLGRMVTLCLTFWGTASLVLSGPCVEMVTGFLAFLLYLSLTFSPYPAFTLLPLDFLPKTEETSVVLYYLRKELKLFSMAVWVPPNLGPGYRYKISTSSNFSVSVNLSVLGFSLCKANGSFFFLSLYIYFTKFDFFAFSKIMNLVVIIKIFTYFSLYFLLTSVI